MSTGGPSGRRQRNPHSRPEVRRIRRICQDFHHVITWCDSEPEGLEEIGGARFNKCSGLLAQLSLPRIPIQAVPSRIEDAEVIKAPTEAPEPKEETADPKESEYTVDPADSSLKVRPIPHQNIFDPRTGALKSNMRRRPN